MASATKPTVIFILHTSISTLPLHRPTYTPTSTSFCPFYSKPTAIEPDSSHLSLNPTLAAPKTSCFLRFHAPTAGGHRRSQQRASSESSIPSSHRHPFSLPRNTPLIHVLFRSILRQHFLLLNQTGRYSGVLSFDGSIKSNSRRRALLSLPDSRFTEAETFFSCCTLVQNRGYKGFTAYLCLLRINAKMLPILILIALDLEKY